MKIEEEAKRLAGGTVVGQSPDAREEALIAENAGRVEEVLRARQYYDGLQYQHENGMKSKELGCHPDDLPQHEKKIAYSTHIEEAVDYISAQLSEKFRVEADDPDVMDIVEATLTASPELGSDDDEEDLAVVNVIREALIAGDVAVRVRWDQVHETPWLEFWPSEQVRFDYDEEDRYLMERVTVIDTTWVERVDGWHELPRRTVYFMSEEMKQCVQEVWLEDNDSPESITPLGIPFIPWRVIRSIRKGILTSRGTSIVSPRSRELADRYDANEQLSFVIARYNSHGNLVVMGDSAVLQSVEEGHVRKDVADVLTFPGGTSAMALTLPSDTQMIEHQRSVLLEALFSTFGLTRLDAEAVAGMGQVSGYALEILNRKSDGTFAQIGKQIARDFRSVLNVAVDLYAWMTAGPQAVDEYVDEYVDEDGVMDDLDIDVDALYPNRKMTVVLGSGYVVDEVMIRDDFTSGLISRAEALRKRGYPERDIEIIMDEIEEERPQVPEVGLSPVARVASVRAGSTLSAASRG